MQHENERKLVYTTIMHKLLENQNVEAMENFQNKVLSALVVLVSLFP